MWCPSWTTSNEIWELSSEHFNNLRTLAHLERGNFRDLRRKSVKIDGLDGCKPRVPTNVGCSIFNDIRPIRDWWEGFHMNNSHWVIRTQTWAISAKDWDVAFFQWSFTWCVREKIGVRKRWVSLHSRDTSFNRNGTMWRCNRISPDTTKWRLLWISGYFRWNFIIVRVE